MIPLHSRLLIISNSLNFKSALSMLTFSNNSDWDFYIAMSRPLSSTTACVAVAPGKDGYLPPYACGALLDYVPSFGAALAFTILILVTTVIYITQGIEYKKVLLSTPTVVQPT